MAETRATTVLATPREFSMQQVNFIDPLHSDVYSKPF